MPLYVKCGDTFFTRSDSLLGKLIRWGEREKGEEAPWTNHAGVIVSDGYLGTGEVGEATVIEALWTTRRGGLKLNGNQVRVFRPIPPYTPQERLDFCVDANHYVGNKYGWWKLGGFLVKKLTGFNLPEFFFIDNRPICSYLAAKVNEAARKHGDFRFPNGLLGFWPGFGMDPQAADPDEMMDFCLTNPNLWMEVK